MFRAAAMSAIVLAACLTPVGAQASGPVVTTFSTSGVPRALAVEGAEVTTVDADSTITHRNVDLYADPPISTTTWTQTAPWRGAENLVTDGSATAWSSSAAYESAWTWRGLDGTVRTHPANGSSLGPVTAVSGRWLVQGSGTVVDTSDPTAPPVLQLRDTGVAIQDDVLYMPGSALQAADPGSVITRDLDTGATDRVLVPGCGHAGGLQVAGSWLLVGCDEGHELVDLTGQAPVRATGLATLGNGFLLDLVKDDDGQWHLIWAPVDDPDSRSVLGTVVDPTYAPGAFASSRGSVPTVAWFDPAGTGQLARLPVTTSPLPAHPTTHRSSGPPAGFTAAPADGGADLSWSLPSDTGDSPITGFVLRGVGRYPQRLSADARQYPVYDLQNGSRRTFSITAVNEQGEGSTAYASVTPIGLPETPLHTSAAAGDSSMSVHWTAPADGGSPITGYTVRAYSTIDDTQPTVSVDGTTLSTTLRGLHNGASYVAVVTAHNAIGASLNPGISNQVDPVGAPSAPMTSRITAGDRHVVVSWRPPASDGGSPITGYLVTLSNGQSARAEYVATSQRFDLLTNGTPVSATVVALNAFGRSSASAAGTAVPAAAPYKTAPPRASASHRAATLSWNRAQANGSPVTGYQLQASNGAVRTVSATTRRTTFTGLRSRSSVSFRVRALSRLGAAPYSSWSGRVRIR